MLATQALHPHAEMPQDIRWMHTLTRVMGGVLGMLVLAAVAVWLGRQPVFQIAKIELDGDLHRNSIPTVQANVTPHLQGTQSRYFSLDLASSRSVFENLPWVRQAMVRRVWPNELRVTLQEHQPAAYWQTGDREDLMVNTHGEIFEANTGDVDDEQLPTFQSPAQATPAQARQMLDMHQRLSKVLQAMAVSIDTLRLTDRGSWSVKLDNDATLELGRGEDQAVIDRTERFVHTFARFKDQVRQQYVAGLVYADLRYPRGYAVRLRGITTMQTISGSASGNPSSMPLNSTKPD
jgi:cell division protein FtsQ